MAALGSYLSARAARGSWLVRIDDLDPPREVPGAASAILSTLEGLGLHWDGAVTYQSRRTSAYEEALRQLQALGLLYPCTCSRTQITRRARRGPAGWIYPGTCRARPLPPDVPAALRVRTVSARQGFEDAIQGPQGLALETEIGDFVVRRRDGPIAYHLAAVVDDAAAGVTEVVRGADLLAATSPQIYLQRQLGLPTPRYAHLPLVLDRHGQKLSKRSRARPLGDDPGRALISALRWLGHPPPAELATADVQAILGWAQAHWCLRRVPTRSAPRGANAEAATAPAPG